MTRYRKKYCAVVRGRVPGIYSVWDGLGGAKPLVHRFRGGLCRHFATLAEALDFYQKHRIVVADDRVVQPPEQVRI